MSNDFLNKNELVSLYQLLVLFGGGSVEDCQNLENKVNNHFADILQNEG